MSQSSNKNPSKISMTVMSYNQYFDQNGTERATVNLQYFEDGQAVGPQIAEDVYVSQVNSQTLLTSFLANIALNLRRNYAPATPTDLSFMSNFNVNDILNADGTLASTDNNPK